MNPISPPQPLASFANPLCNDTPAISVTVSPAYGTRNVASAGIPRRLGFEHTLTIENETLAPDGSPRDTQVWEKRR